MGLRYKEVEEPSLGTGNAESGDTQTVIVRLPHEQMPLVRCSVVRNTSPLLATYSLAPGVETGVCRGRLRAF